MKILETAGMKLDKWAANHEEMLEKTEASIQPAARNLGPDDVVSTLGLQWSPFTDTFHYRVQMTTNATATTKRVILSKIARLYDPLRWLAPIVIRAKLLLQLLWISGQDWDAAVDAEASRNWEDFRRQLPDLEQLSVPQWTGVLSTSSYQLHGFADASEKAYAATVYLVLMHDSTGSPAPCSPPRAR